MLTGHMWVLELLAGIQNKFRLHLDVIVKYFLHLLMNFIHWDTLIQSMSHSKSSSLSFSIAVPLACQFDTLENSFRDPMIPSHGEYSYSHRQIFLIHSPSSYFKKMLFIFSSPPFYSNHVKLPKESDPIPPEIHNNPIFFRYLKDALGTIDVSHIHFAPTAYLHNLYQNRKCFKSQNCLFACLFCLRFCYTVTRWEGSATDAHV